MVMAASVASFPPPPLTTAPVGTSCLGLCGKSWEEIEELVTPTKADDEQLQACFVQVQEVFSALGSVVKAGSFGKGTHVKFKADVDVVILFAEFQVDQHEHKLAQLKAIASDNAKLFTALKSTGYSVQFRVGNVDVDVLPAMELNDPVRHLQEFKGDPRLAACASLLQIAFIQAQPRRYRTLVRIVKWWRQQRVWSERSALPLSYFLELLVLDVYNQYARVETEFAGLFQRVLEALLRNERRPIRFNAFYQLEQADEVCKSRESHFIVVDPANPHKNVADNLRDPAPLLEYAAETLRDLKRSMAMHFLECKTSADQQLQKHTEETTRQRRIIALLTSLMCMDRSVEYTLRLPDLDKMTTIQSSPFLTRGPFTFRFQAVIEQIEEKNRYPAITKFLQMRLIVGVSSEWLELRFDLQQLQNGADPWPIIEVGLRFKRPHVQEPSDKLITKLQNPAPVAENVTYKLTTVATSIKSGRYQPHSLDVSHFRGNHNQSETQVLCSVALLPSS
jgi:hypothetical protein